MSTVVVLAEPPVEGVVLEELVASSPLSAADATRLYAAMCRDVCAAVQAGPGDLLVNYRSTDQLSADVDSQARLEALLADHVPRPSDVRYEVQVGESPAARAGNTATHLLETEDVESVTLLHPTAAFLSREHLGTIAMKLRTRDVVLGPTTGGRTYLVGLTAPVDFTDIYDPPAIETVTDRALSAEQDVGFGPILPVIEAGRDLLTAVPYLRARVRAGRNVPPETATVIDDLGLGVTDRNGELDLEMASTG